MTHCYYNDFTMKFTVYNVRTNNYDNTGRFFLGVKSLFLDSRESFIESGDHISVSVYLFLSGTTRPHFVHWKQP